MESRILVSEQPNQLISHSNRMQTNISFFFPSSNFSESFGLYHVDFSSPERKRTPKLSAKVYANIIRTHAIDWNFRPEPTVIASRQLYDESMNSSSVAMMSPFSILCAVLIQYSIYLILRN